MSRYRNIGWFNGYTTGNDSVCNDCGVQVLNIPAHEDFHDRLDTLADWVVELRGSNK